jgi:hypothetical protein
MRSSVLSPIEPVAPSTDMRRRLATLVSISMESDVTDGNTDVILTR